MCGEYVAVHPRHVRGRQEEARCLDIHRHDPAFRRPRGGRRPRQSSADDPDQSSGIGPQPPARRRLA